MTIPPKLSPGDTIRVVAPAKSLSVISKEQLDLATQRLTEEGFTVTFSKNCQEQDMFDSSSIESRVADLHEAFADPGVKAILTVLGGFNSNQVLQYLDYDLIKSNPKILCGYSDITALANAITSKTGLVTYSGLHYSTWGMEKEFSYNKHYFAKCLYSEEPFDVLPAETWSDDEWYIDQQSRVLEKNSGLWTIQEGSCEGHIIGGNLCTLNLLQGTPYMPSLVGAVLFIEDDHVVDAVTFERDLQSLLHLPDASQLRGVVIGRFQRASNVTRKQITHIIQTKELLQDIPVLANADFGHTNPLFTFPIGGTVRITASNTPRITIMKH